VGVPITLALILTWIVMVFVYESFIAAQKMPATARTAVK